MDAGKSLAWPSLQCLTPRVWFLGAVDVSQSSCGILSALLITQPARQGAASQCKPSARTCHRHHMRSLALAATAFL
eukprot:2743771-Amphidinium_carterae.1